MIVIPKCFRCRHYEDGKCPAHPKGIPKEVLATQSKEKACGTNIRYEKRNCTGIC